ncbi:hypothetical protein ACT3TY_11045 [Halomonas sp. AOP22-C1-8]|uniref:hypothetical protein n=1 Tax=Halomonas sp. AOP22-C1-8 TaxID=3457717 RepID=UPI004034189B
MRRAAAAGALRLHHTTVTALCIDIRRIVARGNAGEERACGTRERRRQPPGCAALARSRTQHQPRQRGALLLRRAAAAGALRLPRTTVEALRIDMRRIVARGNAGEERACGTRERRRQPPGCAALAWSRTQP